MLIKKKQLEQILYYIFELFNVLPTRCTCAMGFILRAENVPKNIYLENVYPLFEQNVSAIIPRGFGDYHRKRYMFSSYF